MAEKPTSLPRWADVSGDIVEPSSGKKDIGWVQGERPPAPFFNWILELLYEWMEYLNAPVGTGAGAGIDATGGSTSGPGLKGTGGAPNGNGVEGVAVGTGKGAKGTSASGNIGYLGHTDAAVHGIAIGANDGGYFESGPSGGHAVHGVGYGGEAAVRGVAGEAGVPGGSFEGDTEAGVYGQGGGTFAGGSFTGGGTSGPGVIGTGGASNGMGGQFAGDGTGSGIEATGGDNSGAGAIFTGGASNGIAVVANGNGTGAAVHATGEDGYGVIAQSDTSSPAKAALRIVPQDTAPATAPAQGDVYVHTGHLNLHDGTNWNEIVAQHYVLPTPVFSAATTTPTSFVTYNIPANTLRVGSTVRIRARGRHTNTGGGGTANFYITATGITGNIGDTTTETINANGHYYIETLLTVAAIGASGDVVWAYNSGHGTLTVINPAQNANVDTVVATDAAIAIDVFYDLSNALDQVSLDQLMIDIT